MMNERYKCCHAQSGPHQNTRVSSLTVGNNGQETLHDHLVHKIFEDIDGLKRSIWFMSPVSATHVSSVRDPELNSRLGDFMSITDMSEDLQKSTEDKVDKVIEPDLSEIEADLKPSGINSDTCSSRTFSPGDLSINYCVKCPVRILNNTSEVEQGEKVLNCVPGSSNCQSTYRQPCVGRRIIANFNQVTHVRSTNNLKDKVNHLVISGSNKQGKLHSHTTNICGSTMEGKAVLSHSNNSPFIKNLQITDDSQQLCDNPLLMMENLTEINNMDILSDVNHNTSTENNSLKENEELTNNNTTPTLNEEDEKMFQFTDPPVCDCDDCMLENIDVKPAVDVIINRVNYLIFWFYFRFKIT